MYHESHGQGKETIVFLSGFGADQDIIFPPYMTAALAPAIPNAQYQVFKNCGHLPHLEQPELLVQVVQDFLTGVS